MVAIGCGDEMAATLGAGVFAPGEVCDVVGTAEPVCAASAEPREDPTMLVECHPHADPDVWLLENPGFVSGGNLRWWRDQFAPIERGAEAEGLGDAYDLLSREAERIPPGAEGLVFLPAMQGAMAPEWNGAARGVFYGLTLAHTRAHMTRAVLEGSAFGLRDILEAMTSAGLDVRRLTIVGGGAKGPLWRQIKSDVTGLPVRVPVSVETTATGAAILAAVGAGVHAIGRGRGRRVRGLPSRGAPARSRAARDLRRRVPPLPRSVFRAEAGLRRRLGGSAPRAPADHAAREERHEDDPGARRDHAGGVDPPGPQGGSDERRDRGGDADPQTGDHADQHERQQEQSGEPNLEAIGRLRPHPHADSHHRIHRPMVRASRVRGSVLGGDVRGRDAAVHDQRRPGHEARVIAGQEQGGLRELIRLPEASHRDVDEPTLFLLLVGQERHQQWCLDRARTQGVAPDPLAGVLDGDLPRHGEHGALGGRVRGLRGRGAHPGDERRHVHDRTSAGREHRRDAVLASEGHALHVDVQRRVPDRRFEGMDGAILGHHHAGVVVEDVEPAETLDRGRHHRLGVGLARHVGVDIEGLAARVLDLGRHGLARVVREVRQDHLGALGRE